MKVSDRVALRWASIQASSEKIENERGECMYRIVLNLGDMTKFIPELEKLSQYYSDCALCDESVHEAFEELFFSKSNKDLIDRSLHNKIRHNYNFDVMTWIEDYGDLPRKVSELKDVKLYFDIGVAFEPLSEMTLDIQKALTDSVKLIFN